MVDLSIVGPIIGILAGIDVFLHVYLDSKKSKGQGKRRFSEPAVPVPNSALLAASLSTLFAFALVAIIPFAWVLSIVQAEVWISFDIIILPFYIWFAGFILLCMGIVLHGWSRYVRQEMASSWAMSDEHRLITTGPYARIRHPSYTSYFLCFIGLCFLVPFLGSPFLLIGFWGYRKIAVLEEENLLHRFGGSYREYMRRTGRFFPGL